MAQKAKHDLLAVDQVTGEKIKISAGSSIKSEAELEASKEYFKRKNDALKAELDKALEEKQKQYWRNRELTKYDKYLLVRTKKIPQSEEMSAANLGRMIYLATFCNYDNRLMLNECVTMKESDLPEVLNLGERKTRDFKKDMKDHIIFSKDGIFIDDTFVYRGERKEKHYTDKIRMYNLAVRSLYRALKNTKHGYFGYVVRLLPYINRKYNIVCKNPRETDINKIEAMTMMDIARAIGYEETNSAKLVEILTGLMFDLNGYQQSACGIVWFTANGTNGYMVIFNPNLLYIGDNPDDVTAFCKFFPNAVKSLKETKHSSYIMQ
jgi:hypothetical protein